MIDLERDFTPEKRAELERVAEVHGCTALEVAAADRTGMPIQRYLALRGVNTLDGFERVRGDEAARLKAEEEVRSERLRERARAAIGGGS